MEHPSDAPQNLENSKSPAGKRAPFFFVSVWLVAVLAGAMELNRYANTPGESASASASWPTSSQLLRIADKGTLVLFVHPECSCSKASIGELERLMAAAKNRLNVDVVFIHPTSESVQWVQNSLWEQARAIPGVNVSMDEGYAETDAFGAKTSGQTFLYSPDGKLAFAGGLTPERGHMGDSEGRRLVLDWLDGKSLRGTVTKVFGCALKEMNLPSVQHVAGKP